MISKISTRLRTTWAIPFIFFVDLIFAQSFEISGKVLNAENSEPTANALILLVETNQYTTSSGDGSFSLRDIKVSKLRLKITHLAFQEN